MKFKVGKINEIAMQKGFAILASGIVMNKEKCKRLDNLLKGIEVAFEPFAKEKEDKLKEIIVKYGTEEEIKQNGLKEDSPNIEDAKKEYEEFITVWNEKEIEVETDITLDFFNDVLTVASQVENIDKVTKYLFG